MLPKSCHHVAMPQSFTAGLCGLKCQRACVHDMGMVQLNAVEQQSTWPCAL